MLSFLKRQIVPRSCTYEEILLYSWLLLNRITIINSMFLFIFFVCCLAAFIWTISTRKIDQIPASTVPTLNVLLGILLSHFLSFEGYIVIGPWKAEIGSRTSVGWVDQPWTRYDGGATHRSRDLAKIRSAHLQSLSGALWAAETGTRTIIGYKTQVS